VTDNLSELSKRLKIRLPNSVSSFSIVRATKHCSRRFARPVRACSQSPTATSLAPLRPAGEFRRGHSHWSRRHAEGVIAAAALKGLGGEIQGMLIARDDEERRSAEALVTTSHEC